MTTAHTATTQRNEHGHVCEDTGRVAVYVKDFAASELNGDAPAYWFNSEAESMGLECWFLIDGIDAHTKNDKFDIWFANSWCKPNVAPDLTIYVEPRHAALAKAESK